MPFISNEAGNTRELLRYTPAQADRMGLLDGGSVSFHNRENERLHPGKEVQYVYIDGQYCGICHKSDKLFAVVEKFSFFIKKN